MKEWIKTFYSEHKWLSIMVVSTGYERVDQNVLQ